MEATGTAMGARHARAMVIATVEQLHHRPLSQLQLRLSILLQSPLRPCRIPRLRINRRRQNRPLQHHRVVMPRSHLSLLAAKDTGIHMGDSHALATTESKIRCEHRLDTAGVVQ